MKYVLFWQNVSEFSNIKTQFAWLINYYLAFYVLAFADFCITTLLQSSVCAVIIISFLSYYLHKAIITITMTNAIVAETPIIIHLFCNLSIWDSRDGGLILSSLRYA